MEVGGGDAEVRVTPRDVSGQPRSNYQEIEGRQSNDTLNAADNTLDGRGGNDTMRGGRGNDTYFVDSAGDVVEELAGEGVDRVRATVSHTLAANVEILNLDAGQNGTGNNLDNLITGNAGDNTLDGRGGNDTMTGGNGSDTFIVDGAGDIVIDTSAGTFDVVRTSASYTLGANADIELFRTTNEAGLAAIDLTGNASSQEIRGNAGNNMINGGLGNDLLVGLGGEDAFIFNTALGAGNIDTISDYSVASDQIRLDDAIFTNLLASEDNWLTADEFTIGAAAADANDRIIYDSVTGALSYDADGSGAGAAVQFANLNAGLALTSDDFYIV